MKIRSKIIYLIVAVAGFLASCSDSFLDRPPLSEISSSNFYQTPEDLRLATAALYAGDQWGAWTYYSYLQIGEVLSGNMVLGHNGDAVQLNNFAVTGLNSAVLQNWKNMYAVIAHSNITIKGINEYTPKSLSPELVNGALAEAKFMRAYAYLNLVVLWQDVPIIEDNDKLALDPLLNRNYADDVFQLIIKDLQFAAENLPTVDETGRVTTWSAQGLLAKAYLAWSGLNSTSEGQRNQALLDSAKQYAGNVCKKSGLLLMDSYEDVFKYENNDNQEVLFALQWTAGSGDWLTGNMLQNFSKGGKEIGPGGIAGWFDITPSWDIHLQYSEADSVRRKATFMYHDDYYAELNQAAGGYTFTGPAGLKKHIIGNEKDVNAPKMTNTSSGEHTPLLRLSDVYLIYAEAILGNNTSTNNADALLYFNKVRERAGLTPVESFDFDMLYKERRLELAAEGHYWADMVRLSFYNPKKAIAMLNAGERVQVKWDNDAKEFVPADVFGVITPATVNTFRLPIPSADITVNPKLLEEPVHYFK